jgi:hypothetical protein
MFQLLLLQVWSQLLPGAGGQIQSPPIEANTHYELRISGVVESNLIGQQFDARFMGEKDNLQTPHTFISLAPLFGDPTTSNAATHTYIWEFEGDTFQGKNITVQSSIIEGLSQSPRYGGAFSADAWAKGMVGNFTVTLTPSVKAAVVQSSPAPEGSRWSLWLALGFLVVLFPALGYLMRKPKKVSEHQELARKVLLAADALEAAAKKRPVLQLDNAVRDAKQAVQELVRAGENASDFAARVDLPKLLSEERDLTERAEKASDEEAKRTWTEAAQEKGKARASVEEANKISERTKARLLRLSASLESTRLALEAPTQNQKTDDTVLTSLKEELRLASEAVRDAEKLS